MMFRPMPVLTVLSIISLVILVMLGNWQYARYAEKIAINSPTNAPIEAVEIFVEIYLSNEGMAQQLYGAIDGEPVWRRYVPGHLGTGELVLVLWDATGGPVPVQLPISEATGPYARVSNLLVRSSARGTFALQDDPENNVWHSPNPTAMAARLGYTQEEVRVVEGLDVTVRNSEDMSRARRTANPYAYENISDPLPPQRHFGYALTWWGMAFGLLGVYLAFHHSQGRLRFRS